jgi:hypothetical protein
MIYPLVLDRCCSSESASCKWAWTRVCRCCTARLTKKGAPRQQRATIGLKNQPELHAFAMHPTVHLASNTWLFLGQQKRRHDDADQMEDCSMLLAKPNTACAASHMCTGTSTSPSMLQGVHQNCERARCRPCSSICNWLHLVPNPRMRQTPANPATALGVQRISHYLADKTAHLDSRLEGA